MFLSSYANGDFFKTLKEGWFYYKEQKDKKAKKQKKSDEKKSDEKFMKSIPLNNLQSMRAEDFRKTFAKAKDISVMHPTRQNVQIVQKMNKWQTDQSEKFTKVSMLNSILDPTLEYPNIPESQYGISLNYKKEDKKKNDFFTKHKNDLGFIVFFSTKDKMAYKMQKLVFNTLEREYGTVIKYINIDKNPEMVKRFKLVNTLENFLIYRTKENKAIFLRVKSGLATNEDIVENTIFLFENAIMKKSK